MACGRSRPSWYGEGAEAPHVGEGCAVTVASARGGCGRGQRRAMRLATGGTAVRGGEHACARTARRSAGQGHGVTRGHALRVPGGVPGQGFARGVGRAGARPGRRSGAWQGERKERGEGGGGEKKEGKEKEKGKKRKGEKGKEEEKENRRKIEKRRRKEKWEKKRKKRKEGMVEKEKKEREKER
jgi:hypothetical protein